MVQPLGRLHHRVPDIARAGRRLTSCHRRRHGIEFDQLHRHGAPCGADPHLRREGPQLRRAEPRRHGHRDRAGEVLITARHESNDDTLVSNLNPTDIVC